MDVPFVNIHSHNLEPRDAIKVVSVDLKEGARLPEGMLATIGVHPYNVEGINPNSILSQLYPYIGKVVGIGEIGLDRISQVPFEIQKIAFIEQLKVAEKYNLPVVIHCVKAYADMLGIVKKFKDITYIFHGYYANTTFLETLLNYDTYFSIGLREMNRPNSDERLKKIPIDRLFLETDDTKNNIEDAYEAASVLYNKSIGDLKTQIYSNFKKVINEQLDRKNTAPTR